MSDFTSRLKASDTATYSVDQRFTLKKKTQKQIFLFTIKH